MLRSILFSLICISPFAYANVVIDTKGVDENQYSADMYECKQLSNQVGYASDEGGVVGSAVGHAARDAALGAAGTAIAGGHGSKGAKVGAGVGLVGGVLGHRMNSEVNQEKYSEETEEVVKNCMTERGYKVLN